jgi:hypothetical protein
VRDALDTHRGREADEPQIALVLVEGALGCPGVRVVRTNPRRTGVR